MRETFEERMLAHATARAANTPDVQAAHALAARVADACTRRLRDAGTLLSAASCANRIPAHRKHVQSRAF
ncbi:MAG: hypothetical protein LPL00_05005 [Alphaproteobacteria bacterium]|nr:hypothetical protein [Alphaproteobacteria bacterium]MDX5368874.1 hypothetical protein [Alphaproteobacteria bacterium]MDX5463598.1 hypothetical protein [Alphaproteobacteria bacterium]